MKLTKNLDKNIFREYDIRGKYPSQINEDVAYTIGRAFGSYLKEKGKVDCVVGRDNRYSSEELAKAFITGVTESGLHVLNIGLVTTPMYYYACLKTQTDVGCMITASHNPKDDNGFKMSFGNYQNAKGQEIVDFYHYVVAQQFVTGDGICSFMNVKESYIDYLLSSITISKPLQVIIDCGNGTTTTIVRDVFDRVGVTYILLYGNSDPNFPNHHPDPSVDENLRVLGNAVVELKADLGLAFDGDGDRVGVVDNQGRIVRMDQLMALFVRSITKEYPHARFLYDVKCGMTLTDEIEQNQAEGIMVRTGNSYTKALTKENDCILGGEYSGHIYFRDKFLGFDSGIYAGLRVLELVSRSSEALSQMVDSLSTYYSTPEIKYTSSDEKKFEVIQKMKEYVQGKHYPFLEVDGLRVQFEDAWVSVRASNTGPNLTMRVEAKSEERKEELLQEFSKELEKYNSSLLGKK